METALASRLPDDDPCRTIRFDLPVAEPLPEVSRVRLRILIVDDDRLMRDMLPQVLVSEWGEDDAPVIETAGAPDEASKMLSKRSPEELLVVLSDYNLKATQNGLDVLANVKRERPDAVRILFSGHTRGEIRGLDGADLDGFLEKPFRLQELVPPFRALIENASTRVSPSQSKRLAEPSPRVEAVQQLEQDEMLGALVHAATKGEGARAKALYAEAERRGQQSAAEQATAAALAWQNHVLESVAAGAAIETTLETITKAIESQVPGMRASILLLDEKGEHLLHGAAPSLPDAYTRAIDGLRIGPGVGSCGTAAYEKRSIIVVDIQNDPLWKDFRGLAKEHGLSSCWSTPILSPNGRLFGTVALYYTQPRAPDQRELQLIELGANLARAAIESHQDREALRRAEAKWRDLYDNVPSMYFTLDQAGTILNVNRFGAQQLGHDAADLGGRSIFDLYHAEDRARAKAAIREFAASGRSTDSWEFRRVTKEGTIVWVAEFIHAADDEQNGRVLLIASNDITRRKETEAELRDARHRLDLALDSGGTGAWDLNIPEDAAVRTRRHDQIFGYDPFTGRWGREEFLKHVFPEEREAVSAMFDEAADTGELALTTRIRRADGAIRWIRAQGRVQYDAAGAPSRMLGVVTDITDQREADLERERLLSREKEALADAEDQRSRLHNLFMQAPAAIAIVDGPEHVLSFANERYEQLVARKADQMIGRPVAEVLPEAVEQGFLDLLDNVRKTGQPFHATAMPFTLRDVGGERRYYLNFVYEPVRGPDGNVVSIMAHAVDVTPQVDAENEAKALAAALEVRVRERTKDLQEANHDLESFSYVVSHDLRAPLRAIHHLVGIALEEMPHSPERAAAHLSTVQKSSEDMARMIEGLLALARATRSEIHREPVALDEVARAVVAELTIAEPSRNVEVVVENGVLARGDPRLLRSVMENLIGNAWKFTNQEPTGRIEFGVQDGAIPTYFVRDNGVGFDMRLGHNLFKPFERLHGTAGFQGSGIGLATVRRIIERHGGRVWAEAAPDEGATFYFTVESSEPQAQATAEA